MTTRRVISSEPLSLGKKLILLPVAALLCTILYLTSLYSYVLFHSVVEIFSIVIACGVFMLSWNARVRNGGDPLTFLGIAYLFVAFIDLLHTLTYRGMNIFPVDSNTPTQLWIAARSLQSLTLLCFGIIVLREKKLSYGLVFATYGVVTVMLLVCIFPAGIFPLCFIEGVGLTPFKIIAEYVISGVLIVAALLVWRARKQLSDGIRRRLVLAIAFTVASELAFTRYISSYGISNLIGHIFKIFAFYFVYRALIAEQIKNRLRHIRELTEARNALSASEQELKEANAAKDRFLAILAHDLRNPFSGLKTLADLMADHYDGLDDESRRRYCGMISEGASQGMEFLDQLLTWAKSQSGKIRWEPKRFKLKSVLEDEIALLSGLADNKSIDLTAQIDEETEVFADPQMISTVVRNFLSNSIKFTPPGGRVVLAAGPRNGFVEVAVSDTGIGIAKKDLAKLFRIDVHYSTKGTEEEAGSGLGLLLCKEFVEKHDARISVESEPGRGSTFKFTLPRPQ
jgi:signal transduction histidine kinase